MGSRKKALILVSQKEGREDSEKRSNALRHQLTGHGERASGKVGEKKKKKVGAGTVLQQRLCTEKEKKKLPLDSRQRGCQVKKRRELRNRNGWGGAPNCRKKKETKVRKRLFLPVESRKDAGENQGVTWKGPKLNRSWGKDEGSTLQTHVAGNGGG